MAVVGDLHPVATRACAQARWQPARRRCRDGGQERARRLHTPERGRVDLGRAVGGHRRLGARRQGSAVRACEQQGLPTSDVLPDARRSEAAVTMISDRALFDALLRFADSPLVLAQRLGAWVGKGPILEEDLALTNVGLDLLGQARLWFAYAGEVEARYAGQG